MRPLQPAEAAESGVSHGLVVAQVSGPSALAGVQPGDLLLAVNGKPVASVEEVRGLVAKSGRSAALLIQRLGISGIQPHRGAGLAQRLRHRQAQAA